ncbi:MAG: hypothetical protein IMZ50_15590 [Candidatus Atribacteria bacterium]|nr:hypothetical protein [Candidatus Atribacteria bacterium]
MKKLAKGCERVGIVELPVSGGVAFWSETAVRLADGQIFTESEAPAECFAEEPPPKFKVREYVVFSTGHKGRIVKCEWSAGFCRWEFWAAYPGGSVGNFNADAACLAPLTPGCYDGDGDPCPEEFKVVDGRKNVTVGMMIDPTPVARPKVGQLRISCDTGQVIESGGSAGDDAGWWIVVPDPDYKPTPARDYPWYASSRSDMFGFLLVRPDHSDMGVYRNGQEAGSTSNTEGMLLADIKAGRRHVLTPLQAMLRLDPDARSKWFPELNIHVCAIKAAGGWIL